MMSKNKDSWLDEPLNKFLDYHIEGWEVIESVRTKAKDQILQAIKEKIETEEPVNVMVKMERNRILKSLGIEEEPNGK